MTARILKSAALASVLSAVAMYVWNLAPMWIASYRWRSTYLVAHSSIGIDVVSLFSLRNLSFWLLLAGFFLLAFSSCYILLRRRAELPLVLTAAVFSFVTIGLLMATIILAVAANSPVWKQHGLILYLPTFMGLHTATFAFFAGMLGSYWLGVRRERIRSSFRLVVEAGIAGIILGWLFGAVSAWPQTTAASVVVAGVLGTVPGLFCAVLFALVFRRRLISYERQSA